MKKSGNLSLINGKRVIAIIPARGGSKGLPGKNSKLLGDKPLFVFPVDAARNCPYIDKVIVSTDDPVILKIAEKYKVEVPFTRPPEFSNDTATAFSVIEHAIRFFAGKFEKFDYIVYLEPTSPFTESADISNALEKLLQNRGKADSIVGVSKVISSHPRFCIKINQEELLEPYLENDISKPVRRQDLDDLYFFEGTLYISDISVLLEKKSFYHSRTLPFVVPKWKALEIDDFIDFVYAEATLKNLGKIKEFGN